MKTNHTPTPLEYGIPAETKLEKYPYEDASTVNVPAVRLYCVQFNERYILQIRGLKQGKRSLYANAELSASHPIVRAVNAHEDMLLALEEVKAYLIKTREREARSYVEQIAQAIAKAEGRAA